MRTSRAGGLRTPWGTPPPRAACTAALAPCCTGCLRLQQRPLTLKLLCARAGVNLRDMQRGYADLTKLRAAAKAWRPIAERLVVVEGNSQLTGSQVRVQARPAIRQHQTERCLVIVDSLQLWAKVAEDLRGTFSVRERVDMLGGLLCELALGLHSPVLALASQKPEPGQLWQRQGHRGP